MRNYKNDNPIKNPEEDILDRSDQAKALAEYIAKTFQEEKSSKSHNIAIRGSWGEGKTSFINLTKGQLEEPKAKNWFYEYLNKTRKFFKTDKGIEIKEFDPWYFPAKCDIHEQFLSLVDDRGNIILRWIIGYFCCLCIMSFNVFDSFFEAIINTSYIKCVLDFISRVIQNIKQTYFIFICSIGIYSIVYPNNIKSLFSKIKFILSLDSISNVLNNFANDKFDPVKAKKRLKKLTYKRKLLIIIDNIDRLRPEQIKRIFDLVKGIGDLPNIIYILAFDNKIASKALNKTDPEEGSRYLDKFIQYPIDLYTSYEKLFTDELQKVFCDYSNQYSQTLSLYITNLRELKRLINTAWEKKRNLENDVILCQLLYITAIGLQDNAIFKLLANSKNILCSNNQDKNTRDKLQNLKREIDELNSSSALWDIVNTLFPRIKYNKDDFDLHSAKIKEIHHQDYFDIYFNIYFPDDLVSELNFKSLKSLVDKGNNSNTLTKSILHLLKPTEEEGRKKIPNRLRNPFKWLDNLTARLLSSIEDKACATTWLLSLAKVTEKYTDYVKYVETTKGHNPLGFNSFREKYACLFYGSSHNIPQDGSVSIYLFLLIYLKDTISYDDKTHELRKIIIAGIEKRSKESDISQLPYFADIIRFADSAPEEHGVVIEIIKTALMQDDALFLNFIGFFVVGYPPNEKISACFDYYITRKDAIDRLNSMESTEAIERYINLLSEGA